MITCDGKEVFVSRGSTHLGRDLCVSSIACILDVESTLRWGHMFRMKGVNSHSVVLAASLLVL